MQADSMVFDLTSGAAISIREYHVSYLHENDLEDITHTRLGQWLLEAYGWAPRSPAPQLCVQFRHHA
jgi:hypothetical protein